MNNKTTYKIASLIMTLVLILGNTVHTYAAGPSIYWGAMVGGKVPSSTNLSGVFATFETRSKKKMSIIHWGQSWVASDGTWGEFQTSYFTNVRNHGSIPMINWASQKLGAGVNQSNFQLRDIYNGNYDTYIKRWAAAAKTWGHPFFLRFDHEMNGWWYPWGEGKTSTGAIVNGNSSGDFVKAWRHVHDIFVSVGANNVTWVWAPNQIGSSSNYASLSTVYPGDGYVDWTGFSVYNKYSTWLNLNPLLSASGVTWLKNSYSMMLSVAPYKPMMLAEWASLEAGDGGTKKAAWITDALTKQIPVNFPKIKAIVWMNWDVNAGKTYPIESSSAATNAWANGISSSIYASNQYASLGTTKVNALASASTTSLSTLADSSTESSTTTTTNASPTEALPSATAAPTEELATPTASPTEPPATVTVSPTETPAAVSATADTYIDSANPTSIAGGASTTLYVSPTQTSFLKFDLTQLAGKTISTVTLKLKTTSDPLAGSVGSLNIKLVNDVLWKEKYMSFSNPVDVSPTLLGTLPANSQPNTWYEIALDPASIQQNIGGTLSVAVESTDADELLLFSRESTDQPQLVITYK